VEGKINGVIIQKGKIEKSEKGFSVNYYPINGEDIEVIDEKGVQLVQGSASVVFKLTDEEVLPNDAEVLEAAIIEFPGQSSLGVRIGREGELTVKSISKGRVEIRTFPIQSAQIYCGMTITNGGNREINTDNLLGTLQKENDEARLIPTLEVITTKGVVTVHIDEIVEFKEKVKEL